MSWEVGFNISTRVGYGRRSTHDITGQLMEMSVVIDHAERGCAYLRGTHRPAGTSAPSAERKNRLPGTWRPSEACWQSERNEQSRRPIGMNQRQRKSRKYYDIYLRPASGTRREDQELDNISAGIKKSAAKTLGTATLVLPSPFPSFFSAKCGGSFAPSLTNCSIARRGLSTAPLGCAASIRTILSAGMPETLAASEATLNTDE